MYYVLALLAVVLSALGPGRRLPLRAPQKLERVLSSDAAVPLAVITLVAAQHAFRQLLEVATYHQRQLPSFMALMPVRFISGLRPDNLSVLYGNGFALLALIETCSLYALYCGLKRPARYKFAIVAVGSFAAIVDALYSRAATSADMYSYVGFTLLGARAYAPPAIPFPGNYALINAWWHTPMVAAPYGPVWLRVAELAAACAHGLFAKIVALRLLGALALLGTVGTLAALKIPARTLALVAINPALIFYFIVNVHNDLFAVMLLLLARYASMRGAIRFACVAAVAASLVKLPFLLFAAFAFAPLPSRLQRTRAFVSVIGFGISISWFAGGHDYFEALAKHASDSALGQATLVTMGAAAILKVVALGAVALALVAGVFVEGCAWALPALGALLHPWYLSWALPYAVESQDALRNVAIALPVATLVADGTLNNGLLGVLLPMLLAVWFAIALGRIMAERRSLRDLRV